MQAQTGAPGDGVDLTKAIGRQVAFVGSSAFMRKTTRVDGTVESSFIVYVVEPAPGQGDSRRYFAVDTRVPVQISATAKRIESGPKDRAVLVRGVIAGTVEVPSQDLGVTGANAPLKTRLPLVAQARVDEPGKDGREEGLVAQPGVKRPPSGYVQTQPGAPISITRCRSDGRYVFQFTRVRNVSENRITSLRFVAVIPDAHHAAPVRIVESGMIPVSLDPGWAAELQLNLLPIEGLGAGPKRDQPTLGLVEARFADEDGWSVRLDADARDAETALYLEKPSVAKALVGAPPPPGSRDGVCRDHRGMPYSPGAIVPVLGEASRLARCEKSAWVAYNLPASPAPH
jgi:hypothetical protein